jgi:membrane protein implicated in regulation of membrane protease activity
VGVLYLAALIFGLGTALVQLFLGGDSDAGADTDLHADVDHADLDHGDVGEGPDIEGDAHGHADIGVLPIFLSLRFWVFGLAAFGLVGTPLHYLNLASAPVTLGAALVLGLSCGGFASWVFKALTRQHLTSGVTITDPVGQVGKVLIPVSKAARGKVRIQVKGQTLDLLARTDEAELAEGELVLVEEMRDGEAQVSRAPSDFLPHR